MLDAIYAWVQEHGDELAPALGGFGRPVLILHGTYDHIPLEPRPGDRRALLPGAELRVLDGIGHFPWLEQPGHRARLRLSISSRPVRRRSDHTARRRRT